MSVKFEVFHQLSSGRLGAYRSADGSTCEEEPQDHRSFVSARALVLENKDAMGTEVIWDRPAFNAGVTMGSEVVAVNGCAMTPKASKMRSRTRRHRPYPSKC